jgi:hypothetical protein
MTPVTISQTNAGRSTVVAADSLTNPFAIGLVVTRTGTAVYNIEISMEDPMLAAPTIWSAAPGFSALAASSNGVITIPCHAISINITSGTGTVTAQIVQAGVR